MLNNNFNLDRSLFFHDKLVLHHALRILFVYKLTVSPIMPLILVIPMNGFCHSYSSLNTYSQTLLNTPQHSPHTFFHYQCIIPHTTSETPLRQKLESATSSTRHTPPCPQSRGTHTRTARAPGYSSPTCGAPSCG